MPQAIARVEGKINFRLGCMPDAFLPLGSIVLWLWRHGLTSQPDSELTAMKEKLNWIKQNLRVIVSLVIVFLGGIGLILSSSLIHSHAEGSGAADSYGRFDGRLSDGVMINVYAVDPSHSDLKGRLLYSEFSEVLQGLNFAAPEGVSPPYLLEFQTVNKPGYLQRAGYVN